LHVTLCYFHSIYILVGRRSPVKKDGVLVDVVDCKQIAISPVFYLADDICRYERTECICQMFLHDFVHRLSVVIQHYGVPSIDSFAGQADATQFLDLDYIDTQFSRGMHCCCSLSHEPL